MTESTPQEYIIGLAKRYKEGKVSKTMFPKHFEFANDWFSFEASNLKGMECVNYTIMFGMSSVQAATILAQPKIKKPLPKFESGCIYGEEIITTASGHEIILPEPGLRLINHKPPTLDEIKNGNGNSISFDIK